MAKFLTLTLMACAFLFCQLSIAQKKNVSGYYISLQGDTVRGVFTGYAEWNRNPSQVAFTRNESAQAMVLTPAECRKFVMEGFEEYLSYSGQRMLNPIDDVEVIKNATYSSHADETAGITAFLRLVTSTPGVNLYEFNDGKRVNLYLQLPGLPVTELRYKKYNDEGHIREIPEYKQQLNHLFAALITKQKLFRDLETLAYKEEEMKSFLEALFPVEKKDAKSRHRATGWYLSAGVSLNTVQVNGDKSYDPVGKSYPASVSPLFSIAYYLPLQRNFGKYFFFPQAKLFRYRSSGESSDGTFTRSTTFRTDLVVTGEAQGGVNLMNRENLRVFLAGSAGLVFQVNGREENNTYATTTGALYMAANSKLSPITYTLNASAGVVLNNRLMVTTTYLIPSLASLNPFYTIQLTGGQLRVGYRL